MLLPQGESNSEIPPKDIKAEIPETYLTLNLNNTSLYIDWSHKWTNVITDHYTSTGSGLYGALSYFGDSYGITLDYKNYSFDILDPYGRQMLPDRQECFRFKTLLLFKKNIHILC